MQWRKWRNWRKIASRWQFELDAKSGPLEAGDFGKNGDFGNPNHNKVSSLSNTTVASIFPNLCLWRRSLRSNLGGIDLEKLYRATLRYQELFSFVTIRLY